MSTLHVLSHSPFGDDRLTSCLRVIGADDALLLCGDAVYALQPGTAPFTTLQARGLKLYALDEDARARAIAIADWAEAVDYPAFVELSVHHDKVNSWL
ncbi:Protein TusB [Pseudomonas fluorescens]|uniref:Protein TusB n=1 Tax=Pseudomonas fluorescens TaxID=294 RepID=A0A5E7QYA3_PSEFL|nr:sulfurtransferase complex subunit TusB [Pseudomonas fluorescens]VVP66037.1 Protein TusB [Pseudomonas fluorescens]